MARVFGVIFDASSFRSQRQPSDSRSGHGDAVRERDVAHRRGPFGIGHDYFVARLEQPLAGDEHAVDPAARDHDFVRRADWDPVLDAQLVREQLLQARQPRRLQIVAAVLVDRAAHRRLDGFGRVEAHVPLIEPERIRDAVHHVADADDAGEWNVVEELPHPRTIADVRWSMFAHRPSPIAHRPSIIDHRLNDSILCSVDAARPMGRLLT